MGMVMVLYPEKLLQLIGSLQKLPGVGRKTAERFAFQIIGWTPESRAQLSQHIGQIAQNLHHCATCGALSSDKTVCTYCDSDGRDKTKLCVVSSPKDIFTIEEAQAYNGLYHVLPCLLSPLDGAMADDLPIHPLIDRIQQKNIHEVILALDTTIEGDATALYIQRELAKHKITASKLALGIPLGSSLDFIDGGTLHRAFTGRHTLS